MGLRYTTTSSWLVLSLLFLFTSKGLGQEIPSKRILFVGNSYTYFWNLPQSVMAMTDTMGFEMTMIQSTSGGASLGHHWRNQKRLYTHEIVATGDFDMVILQDHSKRAVDHPDSLLMFGKMWAKEIKKTGADIYLYMTWAREKKPEMMEPIREKYLQLAEEIDATVVPVGPAWERAKELRPDFPLYHPDGSHPSPTGTYLAACVFYGVLTGKSPVGLPPRLLTTDKDGQKVYLNIQMKDDALFCQTVAAEILQQKVYQK